jgi:hypothetical protein
MGLIGSNKHLHWHIKNIRDQLDVNLKYAKDVNQGPLFEILNGHIEDHLKGIERHFPPDPQHIEETKE